MAPYSYGPERFAASGDTFKTDVAISRTDRGGPHKALTRWSAPSDVPSEQADGDAARSDGPEQPLEGGSAAHKIGSWNQFEANERLYGTRSFFLLMFFSFGVATSPLRLARFRD